MRMKKNELLIYVIYTIYVLYNLLYTTSIKNLFGIVPLDVLSRFVAIITTLMLFYYFISRLKIKYWLIFGMVVFCVIIATLNISSLSLLISVLFMFAVVDIDLNRLSSYAFYVNTFFVFTIVFFSLIGVLPIRLKEQSGLNYVMGFVATNTFSIAVLRSVLLYVLSRYKKLSWRHCICFSIIGWFVYDLTKSRIFFVSIILIVFLIIYSKKLKYAFSSKLFFCIYMLIVPVFIFLSVYYGSLYSPEIDKMVELNKLFSGRLFFINYYLSQYGISMWGQEIEYTTVHSTLSDGTIWFGLDNSYVYALICFGAVVSLILLLIFETLIYKTYKLNYRPLIIYIIIMSIIGITENGLFYVTMNFAMLYTLNLFTRRKLVLKVVK